MLAYVALFSNIFIPLIYNLKPDQFDLSNLWCCFLQTLLHIAKVNKWLQAPAFLVSASKRYTGVPLPPSLPSRFSFIKYCFPLGVYLLCPSAVPVLFSLCSCSCLCRSRCHFSVQYFFLSVSCQGLDTYVFTSPLLASRKRNFWQTCSCQ